MVDLLPPVILLFCEQKRGPTDAHHFEKGTMARRFMRVARETPPSLAIFKLVDEEAQICITSQTVLPQA